jgi:hypothetical protein
MTPLPAGDGPLDNPLKGWAAYCEPDSPQSLPVAMAYFLASWRRLEPSPGRFAFDDWERHWDNPRGRGKRVIPRLHLDVPGQPSGVPEWVLATGVRQTPYSEHGGGLSPDYDDPRLLDPLLRFIAAFGARYNNDPRVAFVPVGTLGFWGEWHTYPHEALFPRPQTQAKVLDAYRKAFPDKHLLVRTAANPVCAARSYLGYHDDLFPEDTDGSEAWQFLPALRAAGRAGTWKTAPIGGEMVPNQAGIWLGAQWETTLARARAGHFTWVGPYCPANETGLTAAQRAHADALVRTMGYEFRLTTFQRTAQGVRIEGVNQGLAPFYYPWRVELTVHDDRERVLRTLSVPVDIRTWQPGPFALEARLPATVHGRLALAIIDPWTKKPAIRFANRLPLTADRRTIVGTV